MKIDCYKERCQKEYPQYRLEALPLNQFSASDGEGVSKYNIALLSTRRRAAMVCFIEKSYLPHWKDAPFP